MNRMDTLGRRIQAGRRAAGLSQEALGERLEVSRQAVSKWEADAAVPELEKLVAMSRLFGVTVGGLLGVEAAESDTPEAADPPPELTERELAAAEAIAARLAMARPRWSGRRRALAALGVTLAAALLVTLGGLALRSGRENEMRLAVLEGRVAALQGTVARLAPAGPGQDSLLLTYDLTTTGLDIAAGTVTFQISATPRERAVNAEGVFTAQLDDGQRLSCGAVYDQGAFVARDWTVPLSDTIQLSLTLTEGESSRTGIVETLYGWGPKSVGLQVNGGWGSGIRDTAVKLLQGRMEITAPSDASGRLGIRPVSAAFCLYRNRETAPEQTFSVGEILGSFGPGNGFAVGSWTGCETTVDLGLGDTVAAAIRVTDNYGQTTYDLLSAWNRTETGVEKLTDLPEDWTPGTSLEAKET